MKHHYFLTLTLAGLTALGSFTGRAQAPRHIPMRADKLGDSRWDNSDGHDLREVSCEGELRVAVVLVDFADVKFSISDDPRQTIDRMLNEPGFSFQGAEGSVFDYYNAQSLGAFTPRFDVYGPVKLDKKEVEYVKTDATYTDPETGKEVNVYAPGQMVAEAVAKLDDEVDFSIYDSNSDGMVDFVYFFFPGKGATTGGSTASTIWPHAYTLTAAIGAPVEVDGVKVNRYATSSELGRTNKLSGIGTFCHEFAHVLGLPDLYDTANNNGTQSKCFTPGDYSCMDAGNYLNDEHTPPVFSSYERYSLEWMRPVTLTGGGDVLLLPLEARPLAYKAEVAGTPQEYFLLEARGGGMQDRYLPQRGLAVWHIDFDSEIWNANRPNNVASHQRIDLIEADDDQTTGSRDGDLFPGAADICEYRSNVSPAFTSWNNQPTGFELSNIFCRKDGGVEFTVEAADGTQMPGMSFGSATPAGFRVLKASPGAVTLGWNGVEEASGYMLSVYPLDSFDGRFITEYLPGYFYLDCGTATEMEIEGLEPGRKYGAILYALGDVNARSYELDATIVCGESAETMVPYLHASRTPEGDVRFEWDAVPGAGMYGLRVGRHAGERREIAGHNADFSDSRLPSDWSGNGKFESRSGYVGEAAPSFQFSKTGTYLRSARYDNPISKVSFSARRRYSGDEKCLLELYAIDEQGIRSHLTTVEGFSHKMSRHEVSLPEGVHQLELCYDFRATGLDLYIDDLTLTEAEPYAFETLYSGETGAVSAIVAVGEGGIPAGDGEYLAYVGVAEEGEDSLRQQSQPISFRLADLPESGVKNVASAASRPQFIVNGGMLECLNADEQYSVHTLDGSCVARNVSGRIMLPARGIYIVTGTFGAVKIAY